MPGRNQARQFMINVARPGGSILKRTRSAVGWLVHSPGRGFVFIFILAFGVRAYSWVKNPPILPSPERELGAIAWSLAETGHFADPYLIPTGHTAHLPPVPPAILAVVLSLFGRTWQAGYVFSGITIMTSAVTYALIPWIAGKLGMGKPAGLIAGVAGALTLELETPDHGEGLAGIALALMLAAFLARWSSERNSLFRSLLLGLGIGASFHVQPPILLVFLGYFAFEVWALPFIGEKNVLSDKGRRIRIGWSKGKRNLAMSAMLALGVVLACVPWTWRNYSVFHEFFFIRSNLGLELRMGNSPGVAPTFAEMDRGGANYQHPRLLPAEALKVKELGEVEYMRQALGDVWDWTKENLGEFFKLTFLRFLNFWFIFPSRSPAALFLKAFTILAILSIWRIFPALSLPQRIALLTPLIMYPLIYYLVPFMPRYRTPIDWMIFMLAGVEIWHWISSLIRRYQ